MNSTLRSIENLLNRFDELSQCHNRLIEDFNQQYSEFDNPLRDVQRNQNEKDQTSDRLIDQFNREENPIDRNESLSTFDQFHRSIRKNCYSHRPPSYSSNHSQRTTQSAPIPSSLPSTRFDESFQTKKLSISSPIRSKSTTNLSFRSQQSNQCRTIEEKENSPKFSSFRSNQRKPIRFFSMETANRLSQPKKCYLSEMKSFPYKPFLDRMKTNNSSSMINDSIQRRKTNSNQRNPSSFSSSTSNRRNIVKEPIRTIPFRFPMPRLTKSTRFQDSSRKYLTKKSPKFISKSNRIYS